MVTLQEGLGKRKYQHTRQKFFADSDFARHTLIPPRGYSVAGVYGSSGPWRDGLGLIITR